MLDDAGVVADLTNENSRAHVGVSIVDVAFVRRLLTDTEMDLDRHTAVVEDASGTVVAAGAVTVSPPFDEPVIHAAVPARHWENGVGAAVLAHLERLAEATVGRADGDATPAILVEALPAERGLERWLEAHGYRAARHFWMMRRELDEPVAAPPLPDGLELRRYEPEAARAIHAAIEEAFRDHWGSQEQSFESWLHWIVEAEGFDPRLVFVAWDDGEVAGACVCEPTFRADPACGLVETLAVRRAWRRRGLGRALLLHAFTEFRRRRTRCVALLVDSEHPTGATTLYRSVGMREEPAGAFWKRQVQRPTPGLTSR